MKKVDLRFSLYKEGVIRLRLAGLVFLLLSVIVTVLQLALPGGIFSVQSYLNATAVLGPMMFTSPVIMVFTLFSFQFKRSATDLYYALPVTRTGLYTAFSLSAFSWTAGTVIITRLVAVLFLLATGSMFNAGFFLLQTLAYCLGSLLVLACALIGVSLTGTRFSAFILTGVLLFLPRCILTLCSLVLSDRAPLLVLSDMGIFFNNSFNIPVAWFLNNIVGGTFARGALRSATFVSTTGWGDVFMAESYVYTCVLALLYMAFGCALFNCRATESAEKSAPSRRLQHMYRCLLITPFFLFVAIYTVLLGGDESSFLPVLIIFTLLLYFLYELITTRRFKNLIGALCVLPIPVVLCFFMAFGTLWYGNAQSAILPAAEEIKSIRILPPEYYSESYVRIRLSEIEFTEPELIAIATEGLKNAYNGEVFADKGVYHKGAVRFQYQNGGSISRQLYIKEANIERFDAIVNERLRVIQAALPEENEIFSISYRRKYSSDISSIDTKSGEALQRIFEMYRQDVTAAGGLPGMEATVFGWPRSRTMTEENTAFYKEGDFEIDFTLRVDGLRSGSMFNEQYAFSSKTPNATLAAMRYANEQAASKKEEVKTRLLNADDCEIYYMEMRLFNILREGKPVHCEIFGQTNEENVYMRDQYGDTILMGSKLDVTKEEFAAFLHKLLSTDTSALAMDQPFLALDCAIDSVSGETHRTYLDTIYVPLNDATVAELLQLIEPLGLE